MRPPPSTGADPGTATASAPGSGSIEEQIHSRSSGASPSRLPSPPLERAKASCGPAPVSCCRIRLRPAFSGIWDRASRPGPPGQETEKEERQTAPDRQKETPSATGFASGGRHRPKPTPDGRPQPKSPANRRKARAAGWNTTEDDGRDFRGSWEVAEARVSLPAKSRCKGIL
jgi:hypothetical protein